VDGVLSVSTTADGSGNFTAVVGPLVGNGSHTIQARARPYFAVAGTADLELEFDYVIDPVSGSDSNSGTPSSPFASVTPLNALATLALGKRIGIRRGSVFRQQLKRTEDAITLKSFGSAAAGPVLFRGDDDILSTAWAPHATLANTYQCTISLPNDVKMIGNVWDSLSDIALVQKTSEALVGATSGTAYVANWSGATSTLTVRLSDDSDPRNNGRTVSCSRRLYGIFMAGNGHVFEGISASRAGHQDGNVSIGANCTARNFQSIGGARHGMLAAPGLILEDAKFISGFNDLEGSANSIVVYANSVAGLSFATLRNTYDGTLGRRLTGIDYHGAVSTELLGSVTHDSDIFINLEQALTAKAASAIMTAATFTNVQAVAGIAGGSLTIKDSIPNGTLYSMAQFTPSVVATAVFNSLRNIYTIPQLGFSSLVAAYRSDITTCDFNLNIDGDKVTIQSAASAYDLIRVARGAVSWKNMTVYPLAANPAPRLVNVGFSGGAISLGDIDYNTYPYGTAFKLNGTDYFTLAEWQVATGKDAHSTANPPPNVGTDLFARADENLEASSTYTRIGGAAGQIAVRSNKLAFIGTTQTLYVVPILTKDHFIGGIIASVPATPNAFPLGVRCTDQNNGIFLRWSSASGFQIYKNVAGTLTSIGGDATVPVVGDTVYFMVRNERVYIVHNGRVRGGVIDITSSGFLTQRFAGLLARGAAQNPALSSLRWGNV
jgi:hypothetical protein